MRKWTVLYPVIALALLLAPLSSHARWMKPDTGRFWTMDSYEGDQKEPSSLHKYVYCANDPVNKVDPSGQMTIASALTTVHIIGTRVEFEAARAGTYSTGVAQARALAEIVGVATVGYLAADLMMERTGVREHVDKAKEEFKKRFKNQRVPKIVPMPASRIPAVAAHIATHQVLNPNSIILTRAPIGRNIINRARIMRGRAPAGFGLSWDEYPFASTIEGGNPGTASVVSVPARENLIQGGIIWGSYVVENIQPYDKFAVIVIP
jgi:RHS repeat-associated protein